MAQNRNWLRPLAFAALAFGAGAVFGGGRMVRVYDWETEWNIDAPLSEVYKVINIPEEQYRWWPSMMVKKATPLSVIPEGREIVYQVKQVASVARFSPPFYIIAATVDIEEERRTRSVVTGDLVGVLETLYYSRPDGGTRIVYHWYVRLHKPILNALGFLFESTFRASHDHVMKEGEVGLQRYCKERWSGKTESSPDSLSPPLPT